MIGKLSVETDWDFGIVINGKHFSDLSFSVDVDSIDQLENIRYLGPFGNPPRPNDKLWEIKDGISRILANPKESFNHLGGNRGVKWEACEQEGNQ